MTRKPTTSNEKSSTIDTSPALSVDEISSALKKEQNIMEKMLHFTVVKRNGSIVPFRRERISLALEAAFRDTKKIPKEMALDDRTAKEVDQITDLVISELYVLGSKGASLTVEGIQDVAEICLMKGGHHDIAKDYIMWSFVSIHTIYGSGSLIVQEKKEMASNFFSAIFKVQKMNRL